jgi:hypothetical protein
VYIAGMRKRYPSDITREQFEVIRSLLESARSAPGREVLIYMMFSARRFTF